jgi:hypothetical protein
MHWLCLRDYFEELVNKGATRSEVRNDYANLGATGT